MASSTPSKSSPNVQHNFDGDTRILNATFERRTEVRKALVVLAQELSRIQGSPTQVKAEIKLQVGGKEAKEHVYNVSITDQAFDASEFARAVPQSEKATEGLESTGTASSPYPAGRPNGQHAASGLSTPRPESQRAEPDDDLVEIRPFKRQRTSTGADKAATATPQQYDTNTFTPQMAQPPTSGRPEEVMTYLRNWHDEWTRQGGWLFDTLTKTNTAASGTVRVLEKKLEGVQDILGQSMNASSGGMMAELSSVTKLVHWLEHCRKTSVDKVQAREEKWKSSSATFHDETRREREAAKKRIERKLEEQGELLMQLARASNTAVGDAKLGQRSGGSDERSREASLGAQLTAELNMEAGRSGDTEDEPFNID